MNNRDNLYHNDNSDYEALRKLCREAYIAGRKAERALALEAHRLRCSNLFGNRCMNRNIFGTTPRKICDSNCWYIKQYELELFKLET